MFVAPCRACGVRTWFRASSRSQVCPRCQKADRSARDCAAGCGRKINVRNGNGVCRTCRMRLAQRITKKLAELARQNDPAARGLFEAAAAFAERPYSALRAAAFEEALAFGASAETLLTEEPHEGSA